VRKDLTVTIDLIKRARRGDQDSKERLIRRYYERVRRIVRIRMDARLRRRLDSGDILQETFMSAVAAFDRFDVESEASFINWLSVIAERKIRDAVDHLTAQRRDARREVSLDLAASEQDDLSLVDRLPKESPTPLSQLGFQEDSVQLEDAIHDLPEQYRELILLRDYAGYSWDEIAKETGRPSESAARMMHARAMVALSKKVLGKG